MSRPKSTIAGACAALMLQTLRVASIAVVFAISASKCGEHTILIPWITDGRLPSDLIASGSSTIRK
jgi:hypothetical protein